jgi:hypothetical protein
MSLLSHQRRPDQLQDKALHPGLEGHVCQQWALFGIARKARRTSDRLNVLDRSVFVSEIRIYRFADMTRQPFDDPLWVTGHGCGRRVFHMLEDGVQHGASTCTSRSICFSISPSMSERKRSFSSPLTMKREKCTVPRLSCVFAKSGINGGSSSVSAFALAGALIGKSRVI